MIDNLNRRVLVVDDQPIIAELWALYMELLGLEVCGRAATADHAIQLAQDHQPAVVLMDMRLEGQKDGVDAALAIHATVGSKVIFITASQEAATLERIESDHPAAVLIKPVTQQVVQDTVLKVISDSAVG